MKLDGKFGGIITRTKDGQIEPDDSWMVFVARDNCLLPTLHFYRQECQRQGADAEQLAAVDRLIDRVEKWRAQHPDRCKTPDAEPDECH